MDNLEKIISFLAKNMRLTFRKINPVLRMEEKEKNY